MAIAGKKLVFSVGLNDGLPFKDDPAGYRKWASMLQRQDKEYQSRFPTYEGVSVCQEWLVRSVFSEWLYSHDDWQSLQLDKDLLGGRVYSPENCVLLTPRMNSVFALPAEGRGKGAHPHGVHWYKPTGYFKAAISDRRVKNHRVDLGYGPCPMEMHRLWQVAKIKQIRDAMSEWQPTRRVVDATEVVIDNLEFQISAGQETLFLNAIPLRR